MANRNFLGSRMYTGHAFPVLLDLNFSVGSSGAVGTVKGPYIKSVIRKGVGAYQIKLSDNYNRYYGNFSSFAAAQTGSDIDPNTGTVGKAYVITTVGDTDWSTAGLASGLTAAVGQSLILAAAPAAGTGRVKAVASAGITSIEVVGDPNLICNPSPSNGNVGAVINIQCFGNTSTSDSTQIPADPADGSVLSLAVYMSNSSLLVNGE